MNRQSTSVKLNRAGQRGAVLILSLVFLVTMTVLGIAAFESSHIQERSASNARLQSQAFEAAAAGAANALNFFAANPTIGADQNCGDRDHVGWANPSAWVSDGSFGAAAIESRMYCLADSYPADDGTEIRPPRSQLFVQSRGSVTIDSKVVASRDIEVRLAVDGSGGGGGASCGAFCVPLCQLGTVDMPESNRFIVDGAGGPAISGGCAAMTTQIQSEIQDQKQSNYYGGFGTVSDPESPWDTAANRAAFMASAREAAETAHAVTGDGACMTGCFFDSPGVDMSGNAVFGTPADPDNGILGDYQVTFIDGDASFGGSITGAGILFINGDLAYNGTINWDGLVVVMGGDIEISGGGNGGNFAGSVIIVDHYGDLNDTGAGTTNIDLDGGGTADYIYDCDALEAASTLLTQAGQDLWVNICGEGGQNYWDAEFSALRIVSWRENVGWREQYFTPVTTGTTGTSTETGTTTETGGAEIQ